MSDKKIVHVAVGVILDEACNILIAKRADESHQGGLWEFPGGKVDEGETVELALARELKEELAIELSQCETLLEIRHDYVDKSVLLDVWIITAFKGKACGNEGQPVKWVPVESLRDYAFPAANEAIISAIESRFTER